MVGNARQPVFTIEADPIGLGFRIRVEWPDASTEYVTGMGSKEQAMQWIENDAHGWVAKPDRLTTPKA
jgi:hypothetical protein